MTIINYHTFGERAGSFGLAPKEGRLKGSLGSSEAEETTPPGGHRHRHLELGTQKSARIKWKPIKLTFWE